MESVTILPNGAKLIMHDNATANPQHRDVFRSVYNKSNPNFDEVFQALKDAGTSQTNCVLVLVNELGLSLNDADKLVLNSTAWAETKDNTLKFRNDFADALDSIDDPEK